MKQQLTPVEFSSLSVGDRFYLIRALLVSDQVDLMTKETEGSYVDPAGKPHHIWSTKAHVYGPLKDA